MCGLLHRVWNIFTHSAQFTTLRLLLSLHTFHWKASTSTESEMSSYESLFDLHLSLVINRNMSSKYLELLWRVVRENAGKIIFLFHFLNVIHSQPNKYSRGKSCWQSFFSSSLEGNSCYSTGRTQIPVALSEVFVFVKSGIFSEKVHCSKVS